MTTKLEYALRLADAGFHVFRLRSNSKLPLAKGWQAEATRDPDTIKGLFEGKDYNIGITGDAYGDFDALVIVDVDTKPGKQGQTTMAEHEKYGRDFPPTFKCRTASGGYHLFYTNPMPLQGGANKLGTHVDVKSAGGYVVGAGSTIDGKTYEWADSARTITPCPDWVRERLGKPKERDALEQAVETLDTPQQTARAIEYLVNVAPTAIKGAGRNNTCYQIVAKLKDYGISETYAAQLMWETYNPTKCSPPYEFERIEKLCNSAYQYGTEPAGISDPSTDFPSDPDNDKILDTIKTKQKKFVYRYPNELAPNTSYRALIKGVLDPEAMSVLYGESNSGKTFVAMDIAFHIARGEPWDGRKVMQGSAVYIAAEGGKSAENRIIAIKQHFNIDTFPLALIASPINLLSDKADARELVAIIKEIPNVKFVVIDTLSRALAGGNENDSVDMGAFVKHVDYIRAETKTHVMVVHHSGKDTAKGARGHSLLRAATDTELEVAEKQITAKKQRDMDYGKPTGFELKVIELGVDADGEAITSCVIQKVDIDTMGDGSSLLEPRDAVAYQALKDTQSDRKIGKYENVVEQKEWANSCKDYNISLIPGAVAWPNNDGSFRTAFKRSRDRLVSFGMVAEIEDKQWVILNTRQPVAYETPQP